EQLYQDAPQNALSHLTRESARQPGTSAIARAAIVVPAESATARTWLKKQSPRLNGLPGSVGTLASKSHAQTSPNARANIGRHSGLLEYRTFCHTSALRLPFPTWPRPALVARFQPPARPAHRSRVARPYPARLRCASADTAGRHPHAIAQTDAPPARPAHPAPRA